MTQRRAHYTTLGAKELCEQIAMGLTLKQSIEKVPPIRRPTMKQVWRWLDELPEFAEMYDRARRLQADCHADRMLEMASEVIAKPTAAAAYRVAGDMLKWQAEMRNPGKYGQKVTHEIKAPPMDPKKLKDEIARLEADLGTSKPNQPKQEVIIIENNPDNPNDLKLING